MATWVPSWHKSLSEKRRIKHFAVPPQDRQDMIHQVQPQMPSSRGHHWSSYVTIASFANSIATSSLWAHSRPSRIDPKINKQSNSLDIMKASATVMLTAMLTATAVVFAAPSSRPWRLRHRNRSPAVDFCSNSGWLRSNPRPKWYPVPWLSETN